MIPTYVAEILKGQGQITHEWSNWDPYELIPEPDDNSIKILKDISLIGNLCFVVGCIELVAYRCAYGNYRLPFEYIEAFWVHLAGIRTVVPSEVTEDDRWEGPLDGPVNLIIGKFFTTYHTSEYGGAPFEAAFAAQVVLHVLNNKQPFLDWQSIILNRLQKNFPSDEKIRDGQIVAPQILDHSVEYSRETGIQKIRDMLASIDCSLNRFLEDREEEILMYVKDLK